MSLKENLQEQNIKPKQGYSTVVLHKGGSFNQKEQEFTKDTEIVSSYEGKNMIVTFATTLIAYVMNPSGGSTGGLQYLAVGTGYGTGTPANPQSEDASYTDLRTELARKQITSVAYLDTNGNVVAGPTNRLQITTTFDEADANGSLVEMGFFGGNATATLGSGYMFNYKVFPVITKDSSVKMTIIWDITF